MRKNSGKPMTVREVTCDKCGAKAHGVPGMQHRRCSANVEHPEPLEKHNKLPSNQRGKWS